MRDIAVHDLSGIPDPAQLGTDDLRLWVEASIAEARQLAYTPDALERFGRVRLASVAPSLFGPEGDAHWRRFFLTALMGDWVAYETDIDRIDFERMKYIMTSAYRWTRAYVYQKPDGSFLPVASSCWYPVAPYLVSLMEQHQGEVTDRGAFLPLRGVAEDQIKQIYVLNISVVKGLRDTPFSAALVRDFMRDRLRFKGVGVLAVTVDQAGQRMSRLINLDHIGDIEVQGEKEALYRGILD